MNAKDRVIEAAREYRRRIKELAPEISVFVPHPEQLEPIKQAARKLDEALEAVDE